MRVFLLLAVVRSGKVWSTAEMNGDAKTDGDEVG